VEGLILNLNKERIGIKYFSRLSLREQLTVIFLLSGTFMAATGFIVDYFAGINFLLMIPHIFVVFGCLSTPLLGKKNIERNTIILVFFVAIVYFPFLFFTCNGNKGVAPFLFLMVMIYFAFFFERAKFVVTYIGLIIYYVAIMYIGETMPQYVRQYEDPSQLFMDKLLGVILVSFALSIISHITFARYREQENKTHELLLELEKRNNELLSLSKIDKLTNVYNRYYFYEIFEKEFQLSEEKNEKFSILMVDIDHFKKINDTYGHLYGDKILTLVANTIKENVREHDIVARYGGEEFVVLVKDNDEESGIQVAERVRMSIENIKHQDEKSVTISIGVSSNEEGKTLQEIIAVADLRLYQAKNNGRNQICGEKK
jgi:diguanylate cyclase (GGDEF)-like protein